MDPGGQRIDSVDLMRGIVIVLMALDHARDFFGPTSFAPENLEHTSAALFFTRWVTHFCAPAFVFLAGTGTALWAAKGVPRPRIVRFLITRGLWLIVLEFLVVNTSWLQLYYGGFVFVQVIWVLGWSMIVLAALIYLPHAAIAAFGLLLCFGHNLLDSIHAETLGSAAVLWGFLHEPYGFRITEGVSFYIVYPLIPWIGVMALGYVFGDLFRLTSAARDRRMLAIGGACIVLFVVLRGFNLYGDPNPWTSQERGPAFSLLSFLNTQKYPPSLLFLTMTLGPTIAALPLLARAGGPLARFFITFGRVPLFFYLVHVPVLHVTGFVYLSLRHDVWIAWYAWPRQWPADYEARLIDMYGGWIAVTLGLYVLCRWYAGVKQRRSTWWLRYL